MLSGTGMVGILGDHVLDVVRCILVKLLVAAKNDDGDFNIAEDGKLVRLLE